MMERGLGSLRGQAAAASGALAATALVRALVTVTGTAVETPMVLELMMVAAQLWQCWL